MNGERDAAEKTLVMLRDLDEEIEEYENGRREVVSLDFYLDEITRLAAIVVLRSYEGSIRHIDDLAERVQEEIHARSSIGKIILDGLSLSLWTVRNLIDEEMDEDLEAWSQNLSEERTFKSLIDWISHLCDEGDTFSAILISSRILAYGFSSAIRGDVDGLGSALDYYNLLTFRLYDPHHIESAPLKFFLYISNLMLTNFSVHLGGIIDKMEMYRRRMRENTKIARMLDRSLAGGSVARISMTVGTANKMAAKLANRSIAKRDDWRLLRELNEVHWLTAKLADPENVREIRALQSNLEAAIHVIRGSERDLELAQELMEKETSGDEEDGYREAGIGLTASAAKLLFLGLSKHSDKVRGYMESRMSQEAIDDVHKLNVDFLKHLEKISSGEGQEA